MSKMPINPKPYKGKYSGGAGRNYASGRLPLGGGGGGKPPKKNSCPLWILIGLVAFGSSAMMTANVAGFLVSSI